MSNPIARINGGFPVVGRQVLSAMPAATITTLAVAFGYDGIGSNIETTLSSAGTFRNAAAEPGHTGMSNGGTRHSVNGSER